MLKIKEKINYAFKNTVLNAFFNNLFLFIIQFILGLVIVNINNIVFFIINLILMIISLLFIIGFCGAYGGGFIDYLISGIISLIFLICFQFIWSLIITLIRYIGIKKEIKLFNIISEFLCSLKIN